MNVREELLLLLGALSSFDMLHEKSNDLALEVRAAKETGAGATSALKRILASVTPAQWELLSEVQAAELDEELVAATAITAQQIETANSAAPFQVVRYTYSEGRLEPKECSNFLTLAKALKLADAWGISKWQGLVRIECQGYEIAAHAIPNRPQL